MLTLTLYSLLIVSSAFIVYQDVRYRSISVWWLLLYHASCWLVYWQHESRFLFLTNVIFCALYMLLCYAVLKLYYYVKTGKVEALLEVKLGWGDVWVFFCLGSCLRLPLFVYFFTLTFVGACLWYFLFLRKKEATIPLAAFMVVAYGGYLVLAFLIPNICDI